MVQYLVKLCPVATVLLSNLLILGFIYTGREDLDRQILAFCISKLFRTCS